MPSSNNRLARPILIHREASDILFKGAKRKLVVYRPKGRRMAVAIKGGK